MKSGIEIVSATGSTAMEACSNAFLVMESHHAIIEGLTVVQMAEGVWIW